MPHRRWQRLNVAMQHFQEYIATKGDNRCELTFIDLLHVSNFKGGNASITEPQESLPHKLAAYSEILRYIEIEFGDWPLQNLDETDVDELIHLCNTFVNLPSNPATKLRGVGASYASALAAAYFLTLIPVLDRRVLNGAVANGAEIDFELDTNGQVRDIQDHFGPLIRYCHATLVENPGQTLRQLDFALFVVPIA